MSYVLAIEPHRGQAEILCHDVGARAGARLLVVDSVNAAMTAIDNEVPQLVLVSALMPPPEEDALFARLRNLPHHTIPQILITPSLAPPETQQPRRRLFGRLRDRSAAPAGCNPSTFADQLSTYLDHGDRSSTHISVRQTGEFVRVSPASGADRRTAVRVEHIDWAKALVDGADVDLVDLSVTGAQVLASMVLPPGRCVQVLLSGEAHAVRCEAGIVWGGFEVVGPANAPLYRAGLNFKDADRAAVKRFYSAPRHALAL